MPEGMSDEGFQCRLCYVDSASTICPVLDEGAASSSSRGGGGEPTQAAEVLEDEDADEAAAEEALPAVVARSPKAPTAAQREAHEPTHLPYRDWCEWCVKHRLDNPPHRRRDASEHTIPEVHLDYAFVRHRDEQHTQTVLILKDRLSKAIRTWVLQRKGVVTEEASKLATEGIVKLGHKGKILIKNDNEPALITLRDAVIAALPEGAIPIPTPPRESESNGVVENGVKLFKGMLRVHLGALEHKLGGRIPSDHPVFAWLVGHIGDVITKHLQGRDGKTGYERLYGKPIREQALVFGEQVWWRAQRRHDINVVLDARWHSGTWLGRVWGSTIHYVGMDSGTEVAEVRALHRRPEEERWNYAGGGSHRSDASSQTGSCRTTPSGYTPGTRTTQSGNATSPS